MNPDLPMIHRLDAIEASAFRAMYAAAPDPSLGIATHEIAGATLLICKGLPAPIFNRVIGLGNTTPASARDLDHIVAAYRAAGLKNWWICLSPDAQPETIDEMLSMRGFTLAPRKSWAKVVRDNSPILKMKTTLEIRTIRPGEEPTLAETLCAAYRMPPSAAPWFARIPTMKGWKAVAAFDGGAMIGAGMLYTNGENAWLGVAGVRPEARGRHAHRALMIERIRLASSSGCQCIATETGEPIGDEASPSLDNMYACGFTRLFGRLNYAAPAPPAA
jgi:hypothetical protein